MIFAHGAIKVFRPAGHSDVIELHGKASGKAGLITTVPKPLLPLTPAIRKALTTHSGMKPRTVGSSWLEPAGDWGANNLLGLAATVFLIGAHWTSWTRSQEDSGTDSDGIEPAMD